MTWQDGTITADGTEQTLWDNVSDGVFSGYVFLDNMQSGDIVEIRTYHYDSYGTVYSQYSIIQKSGAQDGSTSDLSPALYIVPMVARGQKVTLKQTAGTYRSYDWESFVQ